MVYTIRVVKRVQRLRNHDVFSEQKNLFIVFNYVVVF